MVGLGAGIIYIVAGYKDRDEYFKAKYKQSTLAVEASKTSSGIPTDTKK